MTYTREKLKAMSDDELGAAVAEVVMNWARFADDWHPSTDWPDCGEVIGRLVEMGMTVIVGATGFKSPQTYKAHVQLKLYPRQIIVFSDSPLRCICIAAVLAVQGATK